MILLIRIIIAIILQTMITMVTTPLLKTEKLIVSSNDKFNRNYSLIIFNNFIKNIFIFLNIYYYSNIQLTIFNYICLALFLIGWIIRYWSMIVLKKYFTNRLGIICDHKLIKHGPYRILIHPSYLGELIIYISLYLYSNISYTLTIIMIMYHIYFNIKKIKKEEIIMDNYFGYSYQKFISTRFRLIPFIY